MREETENANARLTFSMSFASASFHIALFLRRRWWFVFALISFSTVGAFAAESNAAPNPEAADVLVFADGDRMHGTLLRRDGDVLVFDSARFGVI